MAAFPYLPKVVSGSGTIVLTGDDGNGMIATGEILYDVTASQRAVTLFEDNRAGLMEWWFLNADLGIPDTTVWTPIPPGIHPGGPGQSGFTTPPEDTIPFRLDVNGGDPDILATERDYNTSALDTATLAFFSDAPAPSPFAAHGSLADEWDFSTLSGQANGSAVSSVANGVATSPLARELGGALGTRPVVTSNAIAGHAAATFSGTASLQAGDETTSPTQAQPFVVAIVMQATAVGGTASTVFATGTGTSNFNVFQFNNSNYKTYSGDPAGLGTGGLSGATPDTSPHILVCAFDGTNSEIRIDGKPRLSAPTTFSTLPRQMLRIGDPTGAKALTAHIGHVLIYQGDLTTVNVTNLEAALSAKWGVPLIHDYTLNIVDRVGVVATATPALTYDPSSFNPVTDLPWASVFWADGPKMAAVNGGDAVGTWKDETSAALDAVQATSGNQPIMRRAQSGWNSKSVVRFDGVDDYITAAAFGTTTPQPDCVVVIGKVNTMPTTGTMSFAHSTANGASAQALQVVSTRWQTFAGNNMQKGTPDTGKHLHVAFMSGTSSTLTTDGVASTTGNAGTNTYARVRLGANNVPAQFLDGDIALAGVLTRALTTTEAAHFLAWSQFYYGTP